jgi:hypothetical protein
LENVLDLQLVYLHERFDVTQLKCIPLSGKVTAIKEKKLLSLTAIENEQKSIHYFDKVNSRTTRVGSGIMDGKTVARISSRICCSSDVSFATSCHKFEFAGTGLRKHPP